MMSVLQFAVCSFVGGVGWVFPDESHLARAGVFCIRLYNLPDKARLARARSGTTVLKAYRPLPSRMPTLKIRGEKT